MPPLLRNQLAKGGRCAVGVEYMSLVDYEPYGYVVRIPCAGLREGPDVVACPKYERRTQEEVDAADAARNMMIDLVQRGLSPCCEAPIDESRMIQSGRHKGHGRAYCSKCDAVAFSV